MRIYKAMKINKMNKNQINYLIKNIPIVFIKNFNKKMKKQLKKLILLKIKYLDLNKNF